LNSQAPSGGEGERIITPSGGSMVSRSVLLGIGRGVSKVVGRAVWTGRAL